MHSINGNGTSKPRNFKIGTLNIGGFAEPTKWLAAKQFDTDLLVLSETHLQPHIQHSLYLQFPDYHLVHSVGKNDKHFTGISMLIKKKLCWAHQTISWTSDNPCHKFFKDNRLLGIQLWCGTGNSCIFLYAAYLPSGARWETEKRKYSHECLEAITEDIKQRGDIPAILLGDLNLTVDDSKLLQQWNKSGTWIDVNLTAGPDTRNQNTCHQGKGSRIDFILASPNMFDLMNNYQVIPAQNCSNHSLVQAQVAIPLAEQIRRTQRAVRTIPE